MLEKIVLSIPIIVFIWYFYKYTKASNDCEKYLKKECGMSELSPLPEEHDNMKHLLVLLKYADIDNERTEKLLELAENLDNAKQKLIGLLCIFIFFVYIPLAFIYFR